MSMKKSTAQFDFAIDAAKRRSKNGKKVGRKKNARPKVAHVRRGSVDARHPMHVTLRLAGGLPNIRYKCAARAIEGAFAKASGRFGLSILEYSLQPDHIHLLVEIDGAQAELRREGGRWVREVRRVLGRAVKGLLVRIARALNRLWNRKGQVFGDRYHVHELRTPSEVRHARNYVRRNAHHHGHHHGHLNSDVDADSFSSARPTAEGGPIPVIPARTWLAAAGWKRGFGAAALA
jgi:putative transposase